MAFVGEESGTGKLIIEDGAQIDGSISVGEYGTLLGNGGKINGTVVNHGTITPGRSTGILNVNGDLENSGLIEFEIAGPSDFDQLNTEGAFTAGGTIKVKLQNGYNPRPGEEFDIINLGFGSFIDAGYILDYSEAQLANPGWKWSFHYSPNNGSISLVVLPEPMSFTLLLICAASFGWQRTIVRSTHVI